MGRWLGIDPGTRRIGVAVGSADPPVASPVTVLPASPEPSAVRALADLAEQYGVEGVVVGLPLNMDGTAGPQALHARRFAATLARATRRQVRLWDERLSSFAADQALAGNYTRKKRRARQDAVAATAMLQDFLGADGPARAERAPAPDEPPAS